MGRIARIGTGTVLVILGLFLLALPGPGILTIAAGLALLARDVEWAGNLLEWMKTRFKEYFGDDEDARDDPRDASPSDT